MKKKPLIIAGFFFLIVATMAGFLWFGQSKSKHKSSTVELERARTSQSSNDTHTAQNSTSIKRSGNPSGANRMSDLEFSRLKVTLPAPVNEPWKAPFLDSASCFEPDKKQAAVDVLPTWIRQALLNGDTRAAARYFWSLIKLAEDAESSVSTKGVLAIYRLGDYNNMSSDAMRKWIESDFTFRYNDSLSGSRESKDIRAHVLRELELNDDQSLDPVIYDAWLRNKENEGRWLASVDFGYYLENQGQELPINYWLQRLDISYGFYNALEIVEKRGGPESLSRLQVIFQELQDEPSVGNNAKIAADVAAALFKQTGDLYYRDYLIGRAQAQLSTGSFESSLAEVLTGLASTNDQLALEVLSNALLNENALIRDIAINALGKASDPAATELLFETAIEKVKAGSGFPAREMHALLAQNNPNSDSKYEWLRQALLSGGLPWQATTSDFDSLEAFRKYGRK